MFTSDKLSELRLLFKITNLLRNSVKDDLINYLVSTQ